MSQYSLCQSCIMRCSQTADIWSGAELSTNAFSCLARHALRCSISSAGTIETQMETYWTLALATSSGPNSTSKPFGFWVDCPLISLVQRRRTMILGINLLLERSVSSGCSLKGADPKSLCLHCTVGHLVAVYPDRNPHPFHPQLRRRSHRSC